MNYVMLYHAVFNYKADCSSPALCHIQDTSSVSCQMAPYWNEDASGVNPGTGSRASVLGHVSYLNEGMVTTV